MSRGDELVNQLDRVARALIEEVEAAQALDSSLVPDEQQLVQVKAYLVLGHSVIEEFLEEAFRAHFEQIAKWCEDDRLIPHIAGRMYFFFGKRFSEADLAKIPNNAPLRHIITIARTYVEREIDANHGIGNANLEDLAKAVGVDWEQLEGLLPSGISDLKTLGSKRGEAGHLSPFSEKAIRIPEKTTAVEARSWVQNARDCAIQVESGLAAMRSKHESVSLSLISDWDGN